MKYLLISWLFFVSLLAAIVLISEIAAVKPTSTNLARILIPLLSRADQNLGPIARWLDRRSGRRAVATWQEKQ